jgi:L-alanine-DL-glutamate epimerase-like enolase superfamily enzyme
VFLRVETDIGVVGWGEPKLKGKADAVLEAVAELEEHHSQAVRPSIVGVSANAVAC